MDATRWPQARFLARAGVFLLAFVALCEVFFRTVVPARESPQTRQEPVLRVMNYDPAIRPDGVFTAGRLAEVRVPYHINAQGWNAGIDYQPAATRGRPLVAVLGDSQIEGFYVPWADNVAARLEALTRGAVAGYAYGGSGFRMAEYVALARLLAHDAVEPDVVAIVTNLGDLSGSLADFGARPSIQYTARYDAEVGGFVEVPPLPYTTTPLRQLARGSALLRYLVFNAKVDVFGLGAGGAGAPGPGLGGGGEPGALVPEAEPANAPRLEPYADQVVFGLHGALPRTRIVFVMDPDRRSIVRGDDPPARVPTNDLLEHTCARHPAYVACLDLSPTFAAAWARDHERFDFDFNPHWNAHGHALAAQALHDFLAARGWAVPAAP